MLKFNTFKDEQEDNIFHTLIDRPFKIYINLENWQTADIAENRTRKVLPGEKPELKINLELFEFIW